MFVLFTMVKKYEFENFNKILYTFLLRFRFHNNSVNKNIRLFLPDWSVNNEATKH